MRVKFLTPLILATFVLIVTGSFLFPNFPGIFAQDESAQSQAKYVGLEKCKSCHPTQFRDFEKRKFSKAWNVLVMRGKTKDPDCLKCHTTGYGKPSGFISEEATPNLKYKQCESCHGAGSKHAADPSNKA